MNWYHVKFSATKSDPITYVRRVTIDQRIQAVGPIEAIERAIYLDFGWGEIEERTLDDNMWIPTKWHFPGFKLWIDEDAATLANMVSELPPDQELRLRGVVGLFGEVSA